MSRQAAVIEAAIDTKKMTDVTMDEKNITIPNIIIYRLLSVNHGFGNLLSVEDTFDFSLKVILSGIHYLCESRIIES